MISVATVLILSGCFPKSPNTAKVDVAADKAAARANVLTDRERAEGWELLFDGKSYDQWKGFNGEDVSGGWVIKDDCLMSLGRGGDIGGDLVTKKDYENFELQLEWRISHGGNSGILYGVVEDPKYKAAYYTGPEYQLLDDVGRYGSGEEWHLTGANYAMHIADKSKKKLQMVGGPEFNKTLIIVNKNHVEHWLNGEKIIDFQRWTDDWYKRKNEGKWKDYPDYGMAKKGKISLQDHGSYIRFRNIKLKVED